MYFSGATPTQRLRERLPRELAGRLRYVRVVGGTLNCWLDVCFSGRTADDKPISLKVTRDNWLSEESITAMCLMIP